MILKKYTLTLILLLQSIFLWSSNRDSIISWNDISYDIANEFLDSAYFMAQKAYKLSKSEDYLEGEMTALYRIGRVYLKKGNLDSSLYYFNTAESIFDPQKADSSFLIKSLIYQGLVNAQLGNVQLSIDKYDLSCTIALKINEPQLCGQSLINVSDQYKIQGNYEEALKALHRASNFIDETDLKNLGAIQHNIGNILNLQNRNEEALAAYNNAFEYYMEATDLFASTKALISLGNMYLEEMKLDSALQYYNDALKICEEKEYDLLKGQIYHNQGECYYLKNEWNEAATFFEKSLTVKRASNSVEGLAKTLERLGDVQLKKDDINRSLEYYLESFETSNNNNDFFQLRDLAEKISDIYERQQKDKEARKYMILSREFQDSIIHSMKSSLIYEIHYNKEKHKVEKLTIELENQIERNRLLFLIGVIILAALGLVMILLNIKRQKAVAEKETISSKLKIDQLINQQDKMTTKAMMDGEERERNKIAGDLHDNLGGILSMVKMYFQSIDKQIDQLKLENIKQYKKANELLDEAVEEVRKTSQALSSANLIKFGLFKTIQGLKDKIEGTGKFNVELNTHGLDDDLGELNQIAIYRIIQELISNTLKHSGATEINIQLNVFEDLFNIIVEDNGIGFDMNEMKENSGLGLRGIESRIESMDGILQIDTEKGRGTNISIDIPLNVKS